MDIQLKGRRHSTSDTHEICVKMWLEQTPFNRQSKNPSWLVLIIYNCNPTQKITGSTIIDGSRRSDIV